MYLYNDLEGQVQMYNSQTPQSSLPEDDGEHWYPCQRPPQARSTQCVCSSSRLEARGGTAWRRTAGRGTMVSLPLAFTASSGQTQVRARNHLRVRGPQGRRGMELRAKGLGFSLWMCQTLFSTLTKSSAIIFQLKKCESKNMKRMRIYV